MERSCTGVRVIRDTDKEIAVSYEFRGGRAVNVTLCPEDGTLSIDVSRF